MALYERLYQNWNKINKFLQRKEIESILVSQKIYKLTKHNHKYELFLTSSKMQTKLDMFIKNKKKTQNFEPIKKNNNDHYHDSSRQHSDTQIIQPINLMEDQSPPKTLQLCKLFILPGPSDTIYNSYNFQKLQKLKENYNPNNRATFFHFLQDMLKYQKIDNVQIIKKIDDNVFWKNTLPKIINLLLTKSQTVSACIPTLVMTNNPTCIITREQALILLSAMFFNMMPRNPLCRTKSFGQFMTRRTGGDKYEDLKLQKLKFIINYFNIAIQKLNDKEFSEETITFQKAVSNSFELRESLNTTNYKRDIPMLDVQFCQDSQGKIEDYYGVAAMVDFANQCIGGGVLRNGCVQEEILFLIFPQAIISMLITPQMFENEAVIIYGLRRYSKYQSYSYTLKYDGPYKDDQLENVNESVMIAIDAINFSSKLNTQIQFNKENTLRQIVKATTGFTAIDFLAKSDIKICTGRWGCGAFKADQVWKFFIQWIASSQSGHSLIYVSDQSDIVKQLKSAVKRLIKKRINTVEMFAIMQHFMEIKQRKNTPKDHNFLQFLKANIL